MLPQGCASGGIIAAAMVVTERVDNDTTCLWQHPEAAAASFQGAVEHNASLRGRNNAMASRLWRHPEAQGMPPQGRALGGITPVAVGTRPCLFKPWSSSPDLTMSF